MGREKTEGGIPKPILGKLTTTDLTSGRGRMVLTVTETINSSRDVIVTGDLGSRPPPLD